MTKEGEVPSNNRIYNKYTIIIPQNILVSMSYSSGDIQVGFFHSHRSVLTHSILLTYNAPLCPLYIPSNVFGTDAMLLSKRDNVPILVDLYYRSLIAFAT